MTNKELQEELKKYPDDIEVNLDITVYVKSNRISVYCTSPKYVKKLDGEIYIQGKL